MSTGAAIPPHTRRTRRARTAGIRDNLKSSTNETGKNLEGLTTVIVEDFDGELVEVGAFKSPLDRDAIVAAFVAQGASFFHLRTKTCLVICSCIRQVGMRRRWPLLLSNHRKPTPFGLLGIN